MRRGDVVKPARAATTGFGFTEGSRLMVRRMVKACATCRGCGAVMGRGGLYAASKECSSSLCLLCVEPAPDGERF